MKRFYLSDSIASLLTRNPQEIIGEIESGNEFSLELNQRDAWKEEIQILKSSLKDLSGQIYFEYTIPRMGKRIFVT
jgi:hypothetical protein